MKKRREHFVPAEEVICLTIKKERLLCATVTATAAIGVMLFYLFIILAKASEAVNSYCITLLPIAVACTLLIALSLKSDDNIPFMAILFLTFLLVSGNAYQTVLGTVSYTKITIIHTFATILAVAVLLLYKYVIKKRILITKEGYRKAIIVIGTAILLMLLILLAVGSSINGAKLWVSIGGMTLQLSEIIKLLFYIIIALIYNSNAPTKQKLFAGLIALGGTSLFLVLLNEFGTVMLIVVVYSIALFTQVSDKYALLIIGGFALMIGASLLLVFGTHEAVAEQSGFIADKLNKIYGRLTVADNDQLTRALQGMINGGWFGADSNYRIDTFSFEADFAPAGVAQYFGIPVLVMCISSVCGLFYTIYLRSRSSELNNRSRFKLAYIFAAAIAVQGIFSLGGNIGVLPCAGIGFPALSWGGTQITALYIETAFIVYGLQTSTDCLPARIKHERRNFYVGEEIQPQNQGRQYTHHRILCALDCGNAQ